MERTIETGAAPELVIDCKSDLKIHGHDDFTFEIECDDDRANVVTDGNRIVISHGDDIEIHAPRGSVVHIAVVGGDLNIDGFVGHISIGHVGGDLDASDLEEVDIRSVGGDCKLEDVLGSARVGAVGGDLEAEEVAFVGTSLRTGGDMSLKLITGLEPVSMSAGGDVSVALPEDANATISITDSEGVRQIQFGTGSTPIKISAGGDVSVNSDGEEGKRMKADIEASISVAMKDMELGMQDMRRGLEDMAREFSTRFSGMGIPNERVERAQRQAEAAARKVEHKLTSRMRHLEEHAHREAERAAQKASRAAEKAGRRERKGFDFKFNFGSTAGNRAHTPPVPPMPPGFSNKPFEAPQPKGATGEEQLLILRMLQEKKITSEQADQLLAALDN